MSKRDKGAKLKTCKWELDNPDWNNWLTSCGNIFQIMNGTPADNYMKYCCYCGLNIEQIKEEN